MICKLCSKEIYRAKCVSFEDGINTKLNLKLNNKESGCFELCEDCYYSENGREEHAFNSYFDYSLGVVIDSKIKRQEIEKNMV